MVARYEIECVNCGGLIEGESVAITNGCTDIHDGFIPDDNEYIGVYCDINCLVESVKKGDLQ